MITEETICSQRNNAELAVYSVSFSAIPAVSTTRWQFAGKYWPDSGSSF